MGEYVFPSSITTQSATRADLAPPTFPSGGVRWVAGRAYRLFKAGSAIADGELFTIDAAETTVVGTDSAQEPVEIHVATAGANERPFGANNYGAGITDNYWFWGICYGVGYVEYDAGTQTVGGAFGCAADGEAKAHVPATSIKGGYFMQAGTADADGYVFFDCLVGTD